MYTDPLFKVFGHGVYLYGICYGLGIIMCFIFLYFTMRYKKFNEFSNDAVIFIGFFATAFGVFSAMIFQGIYDVIDGKEFSLGGMTFIGGLIGGVAGFLGVWNLYMYVIRPRTKIKWLKTEMNATLCDALPFIPIGITIAHAIGRLGCFFGGCCYGIEAEWGLPCAAGSTRNVIPTQLFEMAFLIILSAVMAFLYFRYKFNYNFALYPIAYGIFRFIIEYFRDDYRGEFIGSVTPSQFWGIIMVIVGIAYIFAQYFFFSKLMKHPENTVEEAAEVTPETETEENS
ncbi:MAG: prolipoprotein diacylglyceryl transferase [Clostridia bacterium]|nr:prolipoprotein diacylglyceryl transferase [Clostridia bacterium]